MMRFNCPSCGAAVSAPEEYAGRSTKCRRCNNPIVVPQPVTARLPSRGDPEDVSTKSRSEPEEPEELEPVEQEPIRRNREPWFYGYLEKYAKILQILDYVIAAGCAVLATILFIIAAVRGGVMAAFLAFLAWVLALAVIAAALLLSLVGVAAILLAVDAARNIRAMKKARANTKKPK